MAERETWIVAPPVETAPTSEQKSSAPSPPLATGGFWSALWKIGNLVLTVFSYGLFGFLCWSAALFFQAPDFSEAKAKFEANGHPVDGAWISELGKVCRNGAGTPKACELLYFNHHSESATLAEATRNNQGGEQP